MVQLRPVSLRTIEDLDHSAKATFTDCDVKAPKGPDFFLHQANDYRAPDNESRQV
ncbi:MAG: hypothetical protein WAK11_06845 [Candidatus Cybelea sp.]